MELMNAQFNAGKYVCVGLDSDWDKIPESLKKQQGFNESSTLCVFNRAIVEATCAIAGFYKPNIAFYERFGATGWNMLRNTIDFINQIAPETPVIVDAKRGDIDNTNQGYITGLFDYLGADAVTVSPYMGQISLESFLHRADKGIIVLCRTSNKGADEFQNLPIYIGHSVGLETMPFYQVVAKQVAEHWNYNDNCLMVVGATCPEELKAVREIAPNIPLLIPGIGAQGGDLEATIAAAMVEGELRAIINSSRGIIFASKGEDFGEVARAKTQELHDAITACVKAAA